MAEEIDERLVRRLALGGELAGHADRTSDIGRRRLRAATYQIVQPVVFVQLTRKLEINRGHFQCAISVHQLGDDCLDHFHDDMDAVLDDVFRNARVPIRNLEGWVAKRLRAVTIDAYRRRRGERGALQRPRVPGWLAAELGDDRRLMDLAVGILEFAGLDVTAGTEVWPIDTWAGRRAAGSGDYDTARRAVVRDVETVLTAMRTRPKWYADYVERPLGRKRPPLLPAARTDPAAMAEQAARDSATDARLTELAAVAVAAIGSRVGAGEPPRTVVVDVLTTVFGADVGASNLGARPGETATMDEWIETGLSDQESIDRIAGAVLAILADEKP